MALEATDSACSDTGRNQACYGNVQVAVDISTGETVFEQAGDQVDLTIVQSLHLSPMDETEGVWGVALLRVQANIPDTLPGQNITFLLFGDVDIMNAGTAAPPTVTVTSTGSVNLRSGPGTDFAVVNTLAADETAAANGRNADSSWLRLTFSDGSTAWVFAQLVTIEGDISSLAVVNAGDEAPATDTNPMQAFYFRSGVGDAGCETAPNSGILIQTPQGVTEVVLSVNEVTIRLASTAFLQAEEDDEEGTLYIYLLEGHGIIESAGEQQLARAGTVVTVPLDADLAASGPPSLPHPYAAADVQGLPVGTGGTEAVEIAQPLSEDEIEQQGVPISGEWFGAFIVERGTFTCADGRSGPFDASGSNGPRIIETSADGETFTLSAPGTPFNVEAQRTAPGVYHATVDAGGGATDNLTWRVLAPDRMEGDEVISTPDGCVISIPFTVELTTPSEE